MPDYAMLFALHATEFEYIRGMRVMLCTETFFKSDIVNMLRFCLPCVFRLFSLIRMVDIGC